MSQDSGQLPAAPGLGPLLFFCARLLDETAQAQVNLEAGERVARPALMRLLPFLGLEGIRPTDLARKVDISKQAVGQSLAELEARGLVDYTVDPHDGRARRVRLTARGAQAFAHGHSVLAFFETELARRIGEKPMTEVLAGLRLMAGVLEQWQTEGAPVRQSAPKPALEPASPRRKSSKRSPNKW